MSFRPAEVFCAADVSIELPAVGCNSNNVSKQHSVQWAPCSAYSGGCNKPSMQGTCCAIGSTCAVV
jgi:hypothetical protein